MQNKEITAAVLIIGDEILSGRTKDTNSNSIANFLQPFGIRLREIRVIGDVESQIVETTNQLRIKYDYVFTCGGIGPTHDDLTAPSIAKAFNVLIEIRSDAIEMLKKRYDESDLTEARLRMARIPSGASLIDNPISFAPGFQIENVFVLAGVPNIMEAMLLDVSARLKRGPVIHSKTLICKNLREGDIAIKMGEIAKSNETVSIGSYPWFDTNGFGTRIIVRGTEKALISKCIGELEIQVRALNIIPELHG